jgi:hypothetical protein
MGYALIRMLLNKWFRVKKRICPYQSNVGKLSNCVPFSSLNCSRQMWDLSTEPEEQAYFERLVRI